MQVGQVTQTVQVTEAAPVVQLESSTLSAEVNATTAFKNNPIRRISQSFNVQFRAEVFNILNRANLAVPIIPDDTDIFDSTGAPNGAAGLLTSTTTAARQIQLALKLIW
jgi:hypothetical protein